MIDPSAFTQSELAALCGLVGVRTVAGATGLAPGFLLAIAPRCGEPGPTGAPQCPSCGTPVDPRRTAHPCRACRCELRAESLERARTLLAAGLTRSDAAEALAAREGRGLRSAQGLVAAAAREG